VEPLDPAPLAAAAQRLAVYQWIILTSQNAVALLWAALRTAGLDARALAGVRIACVGRSTSDALLARGLAADVVPTRFVAEGVLDALSTRDDVRDRRVLYVASEDARDVLPAGLRGMGCVVDQVAAYRTRADGAGAEALRDALIRGDVDVVTFASASAVRGFVDAVGESLAACAPAVTIGPVTSDAARAAGVGVIAEASEASIAGIVAAVETVLAAKQTDRPRAGRSGAVGKVDTPLERP
jgi:uroporphyrinogen-III synthase